MEALWTLDEQGFADVEDLFDYAGYKARDMREPLGEIKDYIQYVIGEQFRTEGGARSGGWEPLSEDYAADTAAFRRGGILELTGVMRDIVESDEAWRLTRQDLVYEPRDEKAAWHQTGAEGRKPGGDLPARPIIELDESDYETFEEIFANWLDDLRSANARRGFPDVNLRPQVFG